MTYDWRRTEFPRKNFPSGRQVGFIAQEVEKVLPELDLTDDKGFKFLDHPKLTAVLVEASKEQRATIDTLRAENDHLRAPGGKLVGRVDELETRILALEKRRETSPAAAIFGPPASPTSLGLGLLVAVSVLLARRGSLRGRKKASAPSMSA